MQEEMGVVGQGCGSGAFVGKGPKYAQYFRFRPQTGDLYAHRQNSLRRMKLWTDTFVLFMKYELISDLL